MLKTKIFFYFSWNFWCLYSFLKEFYTFYSKFINFFDKNQKLVNPRILWNYEVNFTILAIIAFRSLILNAFLFLVFWISPAEFYYHQAGALLHSDSFLISGFSSTLRTCTATCTCINSYSTFYHRRIFLLLCAFMPDFFRCNILCSVYVLLFVGTLAWLLSGRFVRVWFDSVTPILWHFYDDARWCFSMNSSTALTRIVFPTHQDIFCTGLHCVTLMWWGFIVVDEKVINVFFFYFYFGDLCPFGKWFRRSYDLFLVCSSFLVVTRKKSVLFTIVVFLFNFLVN